MRKALVLMALTCWVLIVQAPAPAWAYHRFYLVHVVQVDDELTYSVETNCPKESKLEVKLSSPSIETGTDTDTVSKGRPKADVDFTAELRHPSGSVTFEAYCDEHPMSVGKAYSGQTELTLPLSLAGTGMPDARWLVLGLCLTLTGGLLIWLGRGQRVLSPPS
jgi:hypothetical protein